MSDVNFNIKFNTYLENSITNNKTKCAIIVTDKQCVIMTASEEKNDDSHSELIAYLENAIHPNDTTSGWLSYKIHDAYLLLEGPELMINLPLDGNLSINQAFFILDIISEICKFNIRNNDMISIEIMSSNDYKAYRTHTINQILKHVLSLITTEYITQDEKIIGKTNINIDSIKAKVYEKH